MNNYLTHTRPSAQLVYSTLRAKYPEIYGEIVGNYRPLKYRLELIDHLYKVCDPSWQHGKEGRYERLKTFAGCVILLFSRFEPPTNELHFGVNTKCAEVCRYYLPNITLLFDTANTYFKIDGFREQCEAIISQINLKHYELSKKN